MKKLLSLLIALLLACTPAAMAVEIESVAGTWVLEGGMVDGTFVNASALGLNMTYTLNADGTIHNHLLAEGIDAQESGVWVQDGYSVTITFDGTVPFPSQLQDGALAVFDKTNGVVMRFVRTESQFTPGAPRTDAAFSDYAGAWESFAAVHSGMQSGITSLQLAIDEDVLVLTESIDGQTTNLVLNAAYANGTITAKTDSGVTMSLVLLENSTIQLTLMDVDYYFRPAENLAAPSVPGMWYLQSYEIGTKTYKPSTSYILLDFLADGSALYENTADGVYSRRVFSWRQTGPLVTISGSGSDGFDKAYFIVENDAVVMHLGDMPWIFGKEALMTGWWYMDKGYTNQGEEFICAERGAFTELQLNQNGTFRMESPDPFVPLVHTGTWTQEGDKIILVLSDGHEETFDISADRRTLTYNGSNVFTFSRLIPLTGVWHMNYITVGDELIDPFERGMHATFTLSSDGTVHADALIYGGEEPMSGTWTHNDDGVSITWNGGLTMPVEIANGEMQIYDPDDGLVFHCTRTELLYADRIGATLEDYQGKWQCTELLYNNQLYAVSALGQQDTIVITGNMVEWIMTKTDETLTVPGDASIESGLLTLRFDFDVLDMQLRGDGYAIVTSPDGLTLYFRKAE